ncbi:MAG: hypothetical protein KKF16_01555, partial [Euryarchaeota archaeon]|nr:hypothetical protein [Euryarchaeota archaeon]
YRFRESDGQFAFFVFSCGFFNFNFRRKIYSSIYFTITSLFLSEFSTFNFTQKERCYGKINRTINLSTKIKVKEATAKYKECKLTITLPKAVEDITKVDIED